MKKVKSEEQRINDLIKQSEETSNVAIKAALKAHIEESQKKEQKALLKKFQSAEACLDDAVFAIRSIREEEKKQAKIITIVDNAFKQFKEDGDWDTFHKAIKSHYLILDTQISRVYHHS